MKRVIAFMAVLCLLLSCFSLASAAVTITKQPETQTVKAGGTLTFKVKAKGTSGDTPITWYFVNPVTGEQTTGKKLSTVVAGVKVQNPNSLNITLKKIPETMHGWTLYCHIGKKTGGVNTEPVMILIAGKEAPAFTPAPVVTDSTATTATTTKTTTGKNTKTGANATETGTPVVVVATPEPPKPVVITAGKNLELYRVDRKGQVDTKAKTELTWEPGETASFVAKLVEGTEGTIDYITVGTVRFYPDGDISGVQIRGWATSDTVKVKINKGDEEEEAAPRREKKEEEPVDESNLVTVTCTNCRFTGYNNTYAETGKVPAGSTIKVFASLGLISKGYTINGEAKQHKNQASFEMVVTADTDISLEKQK